MSNVRTHIEPIITTLINLSRRRRVASLSLLLFCLAAGVRLVSIEAAAFEPKGAVGRKSLVDRSSLITRLPRDWPSMPMPTFLITVIFREARVSVDRFLPAPAVMTSSPRNILLLELIAGRKGLVVQGLIKARLLLLMLITICPQWLLQLRRKLWRTNAIEP